MMIKGQYLVNQYRKGRHIDQRLIDNAITYDGLNAILNAFIFGTYVSQNWFFGLIDAANSNTIGVATDTMIDHPTWQESQIYDPVADTVTISSASTPILGRPRWPYSLPIVVPAISGANVTIIASGEGLISGIFICSDYTIGGADGVLFSTGLNPQGMYIYPDDQITISYLLRSRTSPDFLSDMR